MKTLTQKFFLGCNMNKLIKKLKILGIILGVLILCGIFYNVFIVYRNKSILKPIVYFIVNHSLNNDCKKASDCNELRPLPKPLQNKKIVFKDL